MRIRVLNLFLAGVLLILPSCQATVAPAVKTTVTPATRLTGREKFAVLPFRVSGYPADSVTAMSQRVANLVELALLREGLPVILRPAFQSRLDQLKFEPPEEADIPDALLARRVIGADIVIEGMAETAIVGVINSFKETVYVIDGRSGELLLMTKGEGDSDIYVNSAADLASKIKKSIH
jgi:hypothetical protein